MTSRSNFLHLTKCKKNSIFFYVVCCSLALNDILRLRSINILFWWWECKRLLKRDFCQKQLQWQKLIMERVHTACNFSWYYNTNRIFKYKYPYFDLLTTQQEMYCGEKLCYHLSTTTTYFNKKLWTNHDVIIIMNTFIIIIAILWCWNISTQQTWHLTVFLPCSPNTDAHAFFSGTVMMMLMLNYVYFWRMMMLKLNDVSFLYIRRKW